MSIRRKNKRGCVPCARQKPPPWLFLTHPGARHATRPPCTLQTPFDCAVDVQPSTRHCFPPPWVMQRPLRWLDRGQLEWHKYADQTGRGRRTMVRCSAGPPPWALQRPLERATLSQVSNEHFFLRVLVTVSAVRVSLAARQLVSERNQDCIGCEGRCEVQGREAVERRRRRREVRREAREEPEARQDRGGLHTKTKISECEENQLISRFTPAQCPCLSQ